MSLKESWNELRIEIRELVQTLLHGQMRFRAFAFTFFFSTLLGVIAFGFFLVVGVKRFSGYMQQKALIRAQEDAEYARKLNELSAPMHRHLSEITLGEFKLPIRSDKPTDFGTKNMGMAEVVLLCDSPETRKWIQENIPVVRNEVLKAFSPMDREELLTKDGKLKLKNLIIKKLNAFLPEGTIQEIYFPRFVLAKNSFLAFS
jgi:hypothetical protein